MLTIRDALTIFWTSIAAVAIVSNFVSLVSTRVFAFGKFRVVPGKNRLLNVLVLSKISLQEL